MNSEMSFATIVIMAFQAAMLVVTILSSIGYSKKRFHSNRSLLDAMEEYRIYRAQSDSKFLEINNELRRLMRLTALDALPKDEQTDKQKDIDASNLRLYSRLFREHQWDDKVIHWSVFEATLAEIADRIEADKRAEMSS